MCAACGRRFELKGVHVLRLAVGGTQGFTFSTGVEGLVTIKAEEWLEIRLLP